MRHITLILAACAVTACSTAPQQLTRSPEKQAQFLRLTEGKVPGPPISCLSATRTGDMKIIDDQTVVIRQNAKQVYVGHLTEGCSYLGRPHYAMLTEKVGTTGLCRGDIVKVVDPTVGVTAGSCLVAGFTPYTTP